ncbi:MAG: nucleotidyltransferase domain-containing protein [Legionellaceae bacterium]|nr:nucleotidyltransferase domain-containing protein [Legionellaceae bacterium]MBP9774603.1 nucleotidyltransferase domain-containing protein [Legionellaceae bacterium]
MPKSSAIPLPPEVFNKLRCLFGRYSNIESVILFGSRAMGTNRENSDIDLCLLGNDLNLTDKLKIENDIDDLLLPWKVDLVLYHGIDNPKLLQHIQAVGKKL